MKNGELRELRIVKQSLTEAGMSPRGGCRKTEGGN